MQDSKLIELLRTLSTRQRTQFEEFMHSPYFNKHEVLQHLCAYLLKEAPDFSNERRLEKERIWRYLYPPKPFNNAAFHRLTSQLLDLLQQFITQDAWAQKQAEQQLILLENLRQRKALRHYDTVTAAWQPEAEMPAQAQLQWLQYRFHREQNIRFIESGERRYDAHLQQQYDALNSFFLLEHWRMVCDMASRNTVIQGKYEYDFLNYIIEYTNNSKHKDNLLINIYKEIFYLLTTPPPAEEPFYFTLKAHITNHADSLSKPDLLDTCAYLLNYSIRQINKGRKEYYREALSHYRFLVERQLIFMYGFLPAANYKNIVTIALALEEYDWTRQFIEEYRLSLPPDTRDNAYTYNLASYYYAVGNYKQALKTLHNVDFIDVSYYLGAKLIQIKSYYETDEGEALLSLLDAFNSYLRRNKSVSEAQRLANANFSKLTKKLFKIKENQPQWRKAETKAKCEDLAKDLQTISPIANKLWIENELGKLIVDC